MAESDADKIRNKRLAKLGGSVNSSPATQTNGPESAADPSQAESRTSSPMPASVTSPQNSKPNPFSQLGIKPDSSSPRINITTSKTTPQKREGDGAPRSRSRQTREESPEEWEDKQLGQIFRITLKPDVTKDTQGRRVFFLESLQRDLSDENEPHQLKTGLLDQALTEAGTTAFSAGEEPLDYLLGCWKRIIRAMRSLRSGDIDSAKLETLKEARRLCLSYAIFAATMPEMFGALSKDGNPLAKHFLAEQDSETGLDPEFLMEATSRFEEEESIKESLVGAVEQLSRELSKMSMNDNFKPYISALRTVVRYPKLVAAVTESPKFLPENVAAQNIELDSILGPFFKISPMQPDVAQNYFSSPRTRDRGYIHNAQNALRLTLQTHQAELFDIANFIVKAGKEPREKILNWFALTCNANHKRRAMRPDFRTISSDGFMVNVTAILDMLCDPFMDATFSKIDRIDVDYLRRNPRVSIADETKVNADQKTSDAFYSNKAEGTNNFISEIFFLTVAAHHYGTEAANSQLENMRKQVKQMEKELERFEAERVKYANQPRYLQVFELRLKKFKDQVDSIHSVIHATHGVLLDETVQGRSMQFMRYVIVWLLRLASGQNLPKDKLALPLPSEPSDTFKCLPQYFVEDIVENFKFITRYVPNIITSTQCEELVNFCITFLRSSEYINSPYCKSGLVTILFHGVWPFHNHAKGVLGDLLNGSTFCHKHLLHALLKFYIECESTGTHTQFFDKFNIRYEIDAVIKAIWSNVIYRDNLKTEAITNTDFFVRFVNLLLNDVTFVLDESFTSFGKIHDLSKELRDAPAGSMDETERKEKEELLEDHKGRAKSYMGLVTETMSMLKLFTEALSTSFTMPEIVQRLADMLDYNLDALVGEKQGNLKVEGMAEYGFHPRILLSDILDVYLNLREKDAFHLAVARDGRSYKPTNFEKASSVMKRFALKSRDELESFSKLAEQIATAHTADQQAEEDLGEIPDELLDPIMGSLMMDPVLLPSSKQIVDRSTIRSHLLSDPTDPFNRVPLKIEQVLPAEEKKKEIMDFIASKKGVSGEAMDTSAG